MGTIAEEHVADVSPPRRSAVLAITLDATARAYDLTALDIGGFSPSGGRRNEVFVTIFADGADIFFYFAADNTVTLDTTAIAAGGAVAYSNVYAAKIATGTSLRMRIARDKDKFLHVKGSGAGTMRIWASSPAGA